MMHMPYVRGSKRGAAEAEAALISLDLFPHLTSFQFQGVKAAGLSAFLFLTSHSFCRGQILVSPNRHHHSDVISFFLIHHVALRIAPGGLVYPLPSTQPSLICPHREHIFAPPLPLNRDCHSYSYWLLPHPSRRVAPTNQAALEQGVVVDHSLLSEEDREHEVE